MLTRIARVVIVGIALTLASVLYAKEFDWPDYYHIEYGLPVAWAIRTLSTIIGPTDSFTFQPVQFTLDFIFWSLIALLILLAANRLRGSKVGPKESSEK